MGFCFVVGLVFFNSARLVFFLAHFQQFRGYRWVEIIKAFLFGIRFDLATMALLMAPAWFLSLFSVTKIKSKIQNWLIPLYLIPLGVALVIVVGDLIYFGDAGRRLSYEIYYVKGDLPATIQMISHYKTAVFLFLLSLTGLIIGCFYVSKHFIKNIVQFNWKVRLVSFLAGAVIIAVSIRGGIQSKPLRPSFAYLLEIPGLVHLVLNPVYTVIYALKKGDVLVPQFMPSQEALTKVREMVSTADTAFLSDEYPLLQTKKKQSGYGTTKPNIVIFLMESWAAKYIGALGNTQSLTPHFDALAKKGLLFTNFFAMSHRSTDGITATCCSVPTFQDMQIIGSSFEQNNFRCLGTLLRDTGYSTLFMHGAKTGSFGLNGFAQMAGFERYIGKEDFELGPDQSDSVWGVYDGVALSRLNGELSKIKSPFLALWFSLTSHSPYHLPKNADRSIGSEVPESEFLNSIAYSDQSLGEFFELASQESYFENTIFIILADHTAGENLVGTYERQHIPMLIYSPSFIPPGKNGAVGSQLDVLPTILTIAGIETSHHSFSRSLLPTGTSRFSFSDQGGSYAWFRDVFLLRAGPEKVYGLYNWSNDPKETKNLIDSMPERAKELKNELYSFVQTSKQLMRENRLAPRTNKEIK